MVLNNKYKKKVNFEKIYSVMYLLGTVIKKTQLVKDLDTTIQSKYYYLFSRI